MDYAGLAALITSITGMLTLVFLALVYLRAGKIVQKADHIVQLSNSNFSALQATLDAALAENARQTKEASDVAAKLAEQVQSTPQEVVVVKSLETLPVEVVNPEST